MLFNWLTVATSDSVVWLQFDYKAIKHLTRWMRALFNEEKQFEIWWDPREAYNVSKKWTFELIFLDSDSRGIPREISESCGNSRSAGMEKVRENEHHYLLAYLVILFFRVRCQALFSDWSIFKMNVTILILDESELSTDYSAL